MDIDTKITKITIINLLYLFTIFNSKYIEPKLQLIYQQFYFKIKASMPLFRITGGLEFPQ